MTAAVSSNLQEINSILRDHNPFSQPPILRAQHVWGESFPDIESLNAHASDAVFSALDDVRFSCATLSRDDNGCRWITSSPYI
ncbi:MAG: hypothetical protein AAF151_17620, partial [Cyanobacteria bacterium J06656_5]